MPKPLVFSILLLLLLLIVAYIQFTRWKWKNFEKEKTLLKLQLQRVIQKLPFEQGISESLWYHTQTIFVKTGFNLTFGNLKIKIYFTEINLIHTSLQRFHIKQSSILQSFSAHSVWLFCLDRAVLFLGDVFEVTICFFSFRVVDIYRFW